MEGTNTEIRPRERQPWFKPQLSFDGMTVLAAIIGVIAFAVRIDLRQQYDEDQSTRSFQLQADIDDKLQKQLDTCSTRLNVLESQEAALRAVVYDRMNIKP